MKVMNESKKLRRAWAEALDRVHQPEFPSDPESFICHTLGYECKGFHQRWWDFVESSRQSLVLAPRGHGKSTIMTIAFSIYRVLCAPDVRILICSDTAAQAKAFLREIKHHLEKNTAIFKKWGPLRGVPWTDEEICVAGRVSRAKEATVTAMGVMGPVISKHYDVIILDDVVDEEAAHSRHMREKLITWFYKELLPTLEPEGKLHVIGTRYHHQDLYGRLIQDGMPTLVDRAIIKTARREEALWEDKFPLSLLKEKRDQAGPAIFNAQYQNDTTAMKGPIFRPEWIKTRGRPWCKGKFQGVDLAIGTKDHNDYFAHVTVGEHEHGLHVLSIYRARLSFEDQFKAVRNLFHRHHCPDSPVMLVGIESNAYQEALAQRLRSETDLPVKSVTQTKDKIARAYRLQGMIETGRLSFPESGAHRLIEELIEFPDSDHDDLVDALEIAVQMAVGKGRYADLPKKDINVGPE